MVLVVWPKRLNPFSARSFSSVLVTRTTSNLLNSSGSYDSNICHKYEPPADANVGTEPLVNHELPLAEIYLILDVMGNKDNYIRYIEALRLKKARALGMYLLLSAGRAHRNEKIIDLLWRDGEPKKSQASLRQTIRHLRTTAETFITLPLVTGNGSVSFDFQRDWNLVIDLAAGLEIPETFYNSANSIRSFFEVLDLMLGLSDSFDGWVEVSKVHALGEFQKVLENCIAQGANEHSLMAAELLVELEPHNEISTRHLMVHHWRNKAATKALQVYNRLYNHLDEEFDQEPEAETMELLAAIKLDPDGHHSKKPLKSAHRKVTLSIQGADVSELDKREASFQSVLVTDLRMRLSRFREWQVVDAQPTTDDFLLITLQLYSLEDNKCLSIEVSHPAKRELIWSEIINDPHSSWHDKVRMLVFNVANALRVVVADRHATDDRAQLYDRWLRSLTLIGTWSHSDENEAIGLLNGITTEAPDFGPAHAELAGIYNIRHILRPGTFQTEQIKNLALYHALEAVALDPLDTRAHRVLAWCYCHKGEFDLAEFHFDQALLLNPQNPHSIGSSALGFAFSDNLDRARELIVEMLRLPGTMEPFHLIYLAACNYLIGEFEPVLNQCETGKGLMSTVGGWHCVALMQLGQTQAAVQRLDQYRLEISELWCGEDDASLRNVIDWYVSCFPLRNETVREGLRQTLDQISQVPGNGSRSVAHLGDVDAYRTVKG